MTDDTVPRTYEALARIYSAEVTGRTPKPYNPAGLEAELFERAENAREWRLGRGDSATMKDGKVVSIETVVGSTIVQRLKRLAKSVNRWTKHAGCRGYFDLHVAVRPIKSPAFGPRQQPSFFFRVQIVPETRYRVANDTVPVYIINAFSAETIMTRQHYFLE